MGESYLTIGIHGVSISISLGILMILLKEYKNRILLISAVNKMYKEYCENHDIPYEPIGVEYKGDN